MKKGKCAYFPNSLAILGQSKTIVAFKDMNLAREVATSLPYDNRYSSSAFSARNNLGEVILKPRL